MVADVTHPSPWTGPTEAVARAALDGLLERNPEWATSLGDHRFDDRLPDRSSAAVDADARWASDQVAAIDAVDDGVLPVGTRVDLAILRNRLQAYAFGLDRLRTQEWDPLESNPGSALDLLLSRDFAPVGDRLRSFAGRLRGVPSALETARAQLVDMPRVAVETAIAQFEGTVGLLGAPLQEALDAEPALRAEVEPARGLARAALEEHTAWLRSQLDGAVRDPRIGPDLFAAWLELTLDSAAPASAVLARAESDLERIGEEIEAAAAALDTTGPREGRVRRVLDRLADDAPVDDASILPLCREALEEATEFVVAHDLVTWPGDPVEIIEMPEIHRGVAVAYCDPPGPLELVPLPTFFAVAPTPADWPEERVRSFYREYNGYLVRELTVHEAMPGHVLQLQHNARFSSTVPVRTALWSGTFAEGWAVYAEEVMALAGHGGPGVRMQQLKMQLRTAINAVLDARVHAHGMTEAEAMALMTGPGHQEEGEAAGKWRRALLTRGQLSTYYVGYTEVADIARDLARARPQQTVRSRHDEMLAHGSPPPRHLRSLLGLEPAV